MKKLMLVCGLMLGAATMTFAQGGGQGRMQMKPEDQAKNLQTALKLSDDQTAKVLVIYTAQAAKRDSLMKAANGDMQSMRGAMGPMREATNTKIKAILTDEQKAEYDKMQANMRQRGGGGGGQGGGGTPPPPPPAK